jgi:hypothetical protein
LYSSKKCKSVGVVAAIIISVSITVWALFATILQNDKNAIFLIENEAGKINSGNNKFSILGEYELFDLQLLQIKQLQKAAKA